MPFHKRWDEWRLVAAGLAAAVLAILSAFLFLFLWGRDAFCSVANDEHCFREWVSALGGWAALAAAIPTIFVLYRQVRDADRHQRTSFAIQLRRQRILAERVRELAYTGLTIVELLEGPHGTSKEIYEVDTRTIDNVIKVLRDETLAAFESEIAFPSVMGARLTADVIENARGEPEGTLGCGTGVLRAFFEHVARQAEDFLTEVKAITGRG